MRSFYTVLLCAFAVMILKSEHASAQRIRGNSIPAAAKELVQDVLRETNNATATITSTTRSPADQASEILTIYRRDGLQAALRLYGSAGDTVINFYDANKQLSRAELISGGTRRVRQFIRTAGNNRTQLMHVTPVVATTFDIAPSSISNVDQIVRILRRIPDVRRVIAPGGAERALHIEINRNLTSASGRYRGRCRWADTGINFEATVTLNRGRTSWNGFWSQGVSSIGSQPEVSTLSEAVFDRQANRISFLAFNSFPYEGDFGRNFKRLTLIGSGGDIRCDLSK